MWVRGQNLWENFLFTMHELNQGVREAEPPTLEKFKKTIPIYYSKIPIFVGSGAKFLKILILTMHKLNQGVRGAEPPDAGNFLNSSHIVLKSS